MIVIATYVCSIQDQYICYVRSHYDPYTQHMMRTIYFLRALFMRLLATVSFHSTLLILTEVPYITL